ncbi:MAG: VOC family protein, partial [Schleiferiaceae bacterium]|nr:VOC family protein [Schleiferiaceae bacterium]
MATKKVIAGIQQMGVGVENVHEAWAWYRKHFGMDIEVFEEAATAQLMLPHTNNKPIPRHAVLAINLQGGGGFEIWQQTKYKPLPPTFDVQLGDLGLYLCKMKCKNVEAFFSYCKEQGLNLLSEIVTDPAGRKTFYLADPYGNVFQPIQSDEWYKDE